MVSDESTNAHSAKEAIEALLDTAHDALLITDQEGQIFLANKHVSTFFGVEAQSLVGQPLSDFVEVLRACCDRPDELDEILKRAPEHPGRLGHRVDETTVHLKQPVQREIQIAISPITASEHLGLSAVWGFLDVTELRQSQAQLRTLAEASPIPLIITRVRDGKILYCNEQLAAVVGRSAREVIGQQSPDFYYDVRDRELLLKRLSEDGAVEGMEVRIRRADGAVRWTIFSMVISELSQESVIIGGLYDITDRKKTEQALRESEERFRGFAENASDLVFAVDVQGQLNYVSPNVQELLGYAPSEIVGRGFERLVVEEDRQHAQDQIQSLAQSGARRATLQFRARRKDGELRWYRSSVSPLRDEEGQIVGLSGTASDTTEERLAFRALQNAHQELKDTQYQLVQSEKMASLGMLVAGIAHEINTPVGAMRSMHDTLVRALDKLRGQLENEFGEAFTDNKKIARTLGIIEDSNRVIKDGASRVTEIVRRLRSFARLDEAELKDASVQEGIEDTLTLVHHELKHGVQVQTEFEPAPPISCYPGRLNQVFLNLIMNARQAMSGPDAQLKIRLWLEDEHIHVSIADSGVGIPPENLKKIFDPGFTTKGVGVGTGLGLSICYKIVEEHHGHIRVESKLGAGTTFLISIPMNLEERVEQTRVKAEAAAAAKVAK